MGQEDQGVRLQGADGHEVFLRLPLQPCQGFVGQGPVLRSYIRVCEQAEDVLQVSVLRRHGFRHCRQETGQGAIQHVQPPLAEGADIHPVGVRTVHGGGGDEQEIHRESGPPAMTEFVSKKSAGYAASQRGRW